jgi:Tfp pilus assembly protein PilF
METPNLEQLLQLGIQTARQGQKQAARMIFQQVLDIDKQNERAWFWMASVVEDPDERMRCLQTVLRINPNNTNAQEQYNRIINRQQSSNSQVLIYGGVVLAILLVLVIFVILVVVAL